MAEDSLRNIQNTKIRQLIKLLDKESATQRKKYFGTDKKNVRNVKNGGWKCSQRSQDNKTINAHNFLHPELEYSGSHIQVGPA